MLTDVIPPSPATKPSYGADLEAKALAANVSLWFVDRDSRGAAQGQPGQPTRVYGKTGRWLKPATVAHRVKCVEAGSFLDFKTGQPVKPFAKGKAPYWWSVAYDGRRDDERSKYAGNPVALAEYKAQAKARKALARPAVQAVAQQAAPAQVATVAPPTEAQVKAMEVAVARKVAAADPDRWVDGICSVCGDYKLIAKGAGECRACLLAGF